VSLVIFVALLFYENILTTKIYQITVSWVILLAGPIVYIRCSVTALKLLQVQTVTPTVRKLTAPIKFQNAIT